MTDHDSHDEPKIIFKTPPKISFIMGILVGVTITALTAFGLNYSLLRSNLDEGDSANANTAKVAGAQADTNTAPTPAPAPAPMPVKVEIEVDSSEAVRGSADAAVTLVQYSDFECSYSGRVQPTMEQLLTDYDGQINLVYRHFPLSFHPNAQKAAEASECAGEQGEFWAMHDQIFANQPSLSADNFKSYAKELGLNTSQFDSCLDDGKFAQKVQDDFTEGTTYGVQGTPATFVNGTLVSGAQPIENFKAAIDSALEGV